MASEGAAENKAQLFRHSINQIPTITISAVLKGA